MTEGEMNMSVSDIDWNVFYTYYPGEPARVGASILPEDSYPGSPAEVEISGIYTCDPNGIDHEWDLVDVIDIDTQCEMVEIILEMHEEG